MSAVTDAVAQVEKVAMGVAGGAAAAAPGLASLLLAQLVKQANAGARFEGVAHFNEGGFFHQDMDYVVDVELVEGHPKLAEFHFRKATPKPG